MFSYIGHYKSITYIGQYMPIQISTILARAYIEPKYPKAL